MTPRWLQAAFGALLLACAPGILPVATGASPAASASAADPGASAPDSGASAPGSRAGVNAPVPLPGASTSAGPPQQGDALPTASARLLPDGCPAPLDGVTGVELVDPLGPASEEASVDPPRCYPKVVVYGRYRNGRFALAADVPGFLARHGAEAANGDGATFQLGPELTIAVWGAHNIDLSMAPGMTQEKSLRNRLNDARQVAPGERLLLAEREGNAIVRASVLDGVRILRKTILEDGLEASIEVTYPEPLAGYFEPIAQRVRRSLRTTSGGLYNRPRKPNRRYPKD